MLTKERTSKNRKFKYVAVALALLSVLVFCFASCGEAVPAGVEYVAGTANKVDYDEGESFDCTGAQIKVTYDNGVTETKDVTKDMVGDAPLTIGTQSVMVTYSENGKTVVGYIPVSVKDPHLSERADALTDIYANEIVKQYPTDAGLAALVTEYVAKVNAAADGDAIDTVVANFNAAVSAYNTAKAGVIAELEAVDYSELHTQFAKDIESVKAQALHNIRVAVSIEQAKEYVANFRTHVENKIEEQKFHEVFDDEGNGSGQIYDKMDILRAIRAYQDKVDNLIEIVQNAHDTDPNYSAAMYNEKMYGVKDDEIDGYEEVRAYLVERYNYITLAINIDGQMESIDSVVKEILTTPIDKLVDLLTSAVSGADVTVYPAEYDKDETGYIDGTDVTRELLNQLKNYDGMNAAGEDEVVDFQTQAEAEFGAAGLQTLLDSYGVNSTTGKPIVIEVIETIEAKYEALMAIRADAAAQDVIDLIADAAALENGKAKADALDAAWAAYRKWGTDNNVFTLGEKVHTYNDNVSYGGTFLGVYAVTLIGDKWNANAMGEWTAYSFTGKKFVEDGASYISTYFVPNLDDLIEATQAQDAYEVKEDTALIGNVVLSGTTADDEEEIKDARAELEQYRKFYHKDNAFAANGLDATEDTIAKAEDRYEKLIEKAAAVNDAIDSYEAKYYSAINQSQVKLADYRGADGKNDGPLALAYKEYCEFAAMNTDNGVVYTDVIANASQNEANLLKFITEYFTLEYEDQRHTVAYLEIDPVLLEKLRAVDPQDTKYREALKKYFEAQLLYIGEDATLDYKTEIDGLVQDNFNRVEIYNANFAKLTAAIENAKTMIKTATGVDANGVLQY